MNGHRMTGHLTIDYHPFQIDNSNPLARLMDSVLLSGRCGVTQDTDGVAEIQVLPEGFGGFHPLNYSIQDLTIGLDMGPQFSQEAGTYRKTWGKIMQPLIIPAVAIDIITSPAQAVFWIYALCHIGFPSS